MDLPRTHTLKEIAEFLGREHVGSPDHPIKGINEIHRAREGDLIFVDHPKYYETALSSAATTILIDEKVECPEGKGLVISEEPFQDFNRLNEHFHPFEPWTELVAGNSQVGKGSVIHPNVAIGRNVRIGKNCVIHSGVTLEDHTIIGNDVIIQANTTIGSDAFYFKASENGRDRMYSCGFVHIEDEVEIGALCSIDRGVTDVTRIGKGTKMDNQVHIGHDTLIGANCLFAAQVGISGCVTIEDDVVLWGQVGVIPNCHLGKGAVLFGQAGVSKDLEGGKTYIGSPAGEARAKFKEMAAIRKLPEIIERLKD